MKLLLIEDDQDLCKAIFFHLKKEGYEAELCHNGEEAVAYIMQYDYDLIILDRMLPSMNGLLVLQQIRRKQVTIPVIMLTAMNRLNDRIDGLDAGADDYLVKPFDMETVLKSAEKTNLVVTVENHSTRGGIGSIICEQLSEIRPTKVIRIGVNNSFGQSGTSDELLEFYGLSSEKLVEKIIEIKNDSIKSSN